MVSSSPSVLMKGYLPLRLSLPFRSGKNYIYIREHANRSESSNNATLFVANVPLVPGILSRLFLLALFERFAEVEKVTVVHNPRKQHNDGLEDVEDEFQKESDTFGFAKNVNDEGKFAHVAFASSKQMKKAVKAMKRLMEDEGTVTISESESQDLLTETERVLGETSTNENQEENIDSVSQTENDAEKKSKAKGRKHEKILNLAKNARSRIETRLSLMAKCNAVMEKFEAKEETDRKAREASALPDPDGFVTVSYTSNVGSKRELDESIGGFGGASQARKGSKRRRKTKDNSGAAELKDFYRFQMRESKKKNLEDLRERFEQDLAAVKKMKDEKLYRPF